MGHTMLKKLQWIAAGLLALYAATGFLLLPYLLKHYSTAYIEENTPGSLVIESASFNPFSGTLELEHVTLAGPHGLELFKCRRLFLDIEFAALFHKAFRIKRVNLSSVAVQLAHFRDGHMSYEWLMQPGGESPAAEPEAAYYYQLHMDEVALGATEAVLETRHVGMGAVEIVRPVLTVTRAKPFGTFAPKSERVDAEPSGWVVDLERVHIASGKTIFQDFAVPGAAYSIQDNIDLSVTGISSVPGSAMAYALSMRVDETGSLRGNGTLQAAPLKHQGRLALQDIPLKKGASYLARDTYMKLESGRLSLDLNVSFEQQASGSQLRIDAVQAVEGVAISDSRDGSPLLSFDAVRTAPITFTLDPMALHIGEISLKGVYANAVLSETGALNFAGLLKKRPEKEAATAVEMAPSKPERPFVATVDRILFENNGADFSDHTVPTGFKTSLRELKGSVSGVSSQMQGRSAIEMQAVIDGYSTLQVRGAVESADPKRFTDVALELRNFALDSLSPYAAKYVGRKVDAGRLYVDLGYKINDSSLDARNGVVVKKITLGESVESEDAVSLPLDLAIALLEDGEGVIDLDIPIEGNLENPDFKYGAALWKAVVNLFTNVASAPFKFIGSLLGIEGETLEAIEFRAGASELLPPEREKLDMLAKALGERPLLLLEVGGSYDLLSDKRALQAALADAALQRASAKKGEEAVASVALLEGLNRPWLSEKDMAAIKEGLKSQYKDPEALSEAYRAALYEALVNAQVVDEAALISLAEQRREQISLYLTQTRNVPAAQVVRTEVAVSEQEGEKWVATPLGINAK